MNILRDSAVTSHAIGAYFIAAPFDNSYMITNTGSFLKKVDYSDWSFSKSIATSTGFIYTTAIDGDTIWMTENYGSYPYPDKQACFNFATQTVTYRWDVPFNRVLNGLVEYYKFVSGGDLYTIISNSGNIRLIQYSFSGSVLANTVLDGTYDLSNCIWFFQNGYIWAVKKATVSGVVRVYKITLGGVVSYTATDLTNAVFQAIRNIDDTKLLIFSKNTGTAVGAWGTFDTSAVTWTLEYTNIEASPWKNTGGLAFPYIEYDTNNFIGTYSSTSNISTPVRIHKIYGIQDCSTYFPNGGILTILPYTDGKFIAVSNSTTHYEIDWVDDSANTITPTTGWQETAAQTLTKANNYGNLGSSIHNFYFTGTQGDVITFTLNTAKDPAVTWTFGTDPVVYISVHELWEEKIANSIPTVYSLSDRTLSFPVPANGNYLVRVQLSAGYNSNPYPMYPGTFTMGYAKAVPSFTHTPDPQLPLSNVSFTDTSTGGPTVWHWDFGDGGTSSLQNPTHAYTTSDVYNVTLTIKG